ncbi:uncharacterized protein LOC135400275 isoform X1 [Ornithodoros turicata]|uniref:uncharacterized protein LOC135400275 isoform X1 n=1 Tax=Ornithodoros turicata TaxID=34597 RepID=UPI00313A4D77
MNPSFVVGLLAFLACFWLGNAGSSPKACPPIKKLFCPKYTRIQFDNGDRPRLMSCAYSCDPSAPHSCYFIEREESDCWNMDNARKGRCYNGICLDEATLAIRTANLRAVDMRTVELCKRGADMLYNSEGVFGCVYRCMEPPTRIVNRPDLHPCLIPSVRGKCSFNKCK